MDIHRNFSTIVYDKKTNSMVGINIEIEINIDDIVRRLSGKAYNSKSKQSTALDKAIKVKVK